MTIAAQLKAIEEPFWHAYFLAIAAQQVGEPTRVADPTARRVAGKEEAEPENRQVSKFQGFKVKRKGKSRGGGMSLPTSANDGQIWGTRQGAAVCACCFPP